MAIKKGVKVIFTTMLNVVVVIVYDVRSNLQFTIASMCNVVAEMHQDWFFVFKETIPNL